MNIIYFESYQFSHLYLCILDQLLNVLVIICVVISYIVAHKIEEAILRFWIHKSYNNSIKFKSRSFIGIC